VHEPSQDTIPHADDAPDGVHACPRLGEHD